MSRTLEYKKIMIRLFTHIIIGLNEANVVSVRHSLNVSFLQCDAVVLLLELFQVIVHLFNRAVDEHFVCGVVVLG